MQEQSAKSLTPRSCSLLYSKISSFPTTHGGIEVKMFFTLENARNVSRIHADKDEMGNSYISMFSVGDIVFSFPVAERFYVPDMEAAEAIVKLLGVLLNCEFDEISQNTWQKRLGSHVRP